MNRDYYDDRSLERGDYDRRDSYESRSRSRPASSRYDKSPAREYHYTRTSDKDIVRYNDDRYGDDRALERRRRSASSGPNGYGYSDRHNSYQDRDRDHHHRHHSHSHSHDKHKSSDRHKWENAGATLVGALAGGEAARRVSKDSRLGTVAGVVVGAWGGHELEKEWEHHENKERRRRNSERR